MESGSAPNPPVPPEIFLTVLAGRAPGSRIVVAAEFQIGREFGGEGRLGGDPLLSRRHATIRRAPDGGLTIEDCGSSNGTYVNDTRVAAPLAIHPGDTVQVGSTTLRVEAPGPASSSRIFISYRRQETAFAAGWLFGRLADRFGAGKIFKDVDAIEPGDDFVEKITDAVASCDVLLALIGDRWLTMTDEDGRRLLDRDDDWVRLEIEAALRRNIRVIPILVGPARMPRAGELPPSMANLARRHALELSPIQFDFDLARLVKVLDQALADMRVPAAAAGPDAADVTVTTDKIADIDRGGAGPEPSANAPGTGTPAQEPPSSDAAGSRRHDPDEGRDSGDLVTSAPAELDAAEQAKRLDADYQTALRLLDAGKWRQAIAALERVAQVSPAYRAIPALLERARSQLAGSKPAPKPRTARGSWRRAAPGPTAAPSVPQTLTATLKSKVVNSVAFSPDGRLLASASDDKAVLLWDPATGKQLRTLTGHAGKVRAVAFSPDGRLLASAGFDKAVRLWDPATGEQLRALTGHVGRVNAMAFSPDGRLLASASYDTVRVWDPGTVQLWDPATGEQVRALTGHTRRVDALAFSPDGRLLASASDDTMVRLWDPATAEQLHTLAGHAGWVRAVAFSPDGRLLASASDDKAVRLWDPATGTHVRTLTGHTGWVNAVAFSPDGRLLASASFDKTVRLWDPATGTHVRTLTGHAGKVNAVAFSPDGRLLASAGADKKIRLWR